MCPRAPLEVHYSVHYIIHNTSLVAQTVKRLSAVQETRVQALGWEDPLEKEMAAHSSTLAWKIPWMEEPCRLQSMGSIIHNSLPYFVSGGSVPWLCIRNTQGNLQKYCCLDPSAEIWI